MKHAVTFIDHLYNVEANGNLFVKFCLDVSSPVAYFTYLFNRGGALRARDS